MSYNTRNYNTRNSGGPTRGYNTAGQFVPATETPVDGGSAAAVGASRPNVRTTILQKNNYQQLYDSASANPNLQNESLQNDDVEMKTEAKVAGAASATKPSWMKSKLDGVKKIPKKQRRQRQNERLRKLLSPKNALMVLNEMLPGSQVTQQIRVEQSPASYYGAQNFGAELTIDGQSFKGFGENKTVARNKAAEQAFRELMIKKMSEVVTSDAGGDEDDEGSVPMIQLASFALHKLFSEWELEGHRVPHFKVPPHQVAISGNGESAQTSEGGASASTSTLTRSLPLNASAMHPCMLLTYMKPRGVEYREVGCTGTKPQDIQFTMAVEIDGQHTYSGVARSKKEARRLAAKAACEALYNITFDEVVSTNEPITAASI